MQNFFLSTHELSPAYFATYTGLRGEGCHPNQLRVLHVSTEMVANPVFAPKRALE